MADKTTSPHAAKGAPPAGPAPVPGPVPGPAVAGRVRASIPVGLHEASLDSPTFRAVACHFADQVDGIERWLESYVKSTAKLVHDILALEETINTYLSKTTPPPAVADGVIDSDYTLLALKRVGDGSREWWAQVLSTTRRMDMNSVEPIRAFLNGEVRTFKDARRALDQAQKTFDTTLARFVAQSRTKEPSAIREDAFAVYETRKAYLKVSMDYCQLAPQLRYGLDKLLVRVCADVWRDMKRSRDSVTSSSRWGEEMERLRGWSKNLEASEQALKRELQVARREIGETTLASVKPSRELEDYNASTVPFLGSRGPVSLGPKDASAVISEKQGWLFLRTISGKPARVNWVRRWYYCRDGIFGWLVQSPQGVLQGDEIGVLLCNAKPAVQEERRFCFEVKTKSQTLLLQAETQTQLTEWLEVFDVAKKHAFEASVGRDKRNTAAGGIDPAFAITPPTLPEFSAKLLDSQLGQGNEEMGAILDRTSTLPVPGPDGVVQRASFDVNASAPRRAITSLVREEGETGREHAARIMQKLDLHRKATFSSGETSGLSASSQASGGIASLISASHTLLPAYTTYAPPTSQLASSSRATPAPILPAIEPRHGSLAPGTLAKPPANTTLSKAAVIASGDRTVGTDNSRRLPTAVLANYWGSSAWGNAYYPRKEPVQTPAAVGDDPFVYAPTPSMSTDAGEAVRSPTTSSHRKTASVDANVPDTGVQDNDVTESFPPKYPPELKSQHAQFRLLFPGVPLDEKLALVFNAAWSSIPRERSTGPGLVGSGRVFVTPDHMYFYSQSMGLVLAYPVSLDCITEVTAAVGKDCDHIYLHLGEDMNDTGLAEIDIKVFLDDTGLLHARLNLLIDDLQAEEPMELSEVIDALVNLEHEAYDKKSPSVESWEEVPSSTPIDDGTAAGKPVPRRFQDLGHGRSGRSLRKAVPKLQLPAHAVVYEPDDMQKKVAERHFEISAKACFHVLFGDRSFIFPKLYFERRAKEIAQGPWELADHGKMKRNFKFKVDYVDMLGRKKREDVTDQQSIDVFSDHATYVVTHVKTPWHLPHSQAFRLVTKVVITHVAKSKCKLCIYTKVDWSKTPAFSKSLVERQALDDAGRDAEELAEVATDQVRKLGPHSRTKRAIQVYGQIGHQTQVVVFTPSESEASKRPQIDPRTLTDILFETFRSFMESVASSLMMWSFAGVKQLFKVVAANRILLIFLALSTTANIVFTSRESSTWWRERKAAQFMNRVGVGPNVMMSKAVSLTDLEDVSQAPGLSAVGALEGSAW